MKIIGLLLLVIAMFVLMFWEDKKDERIYTVRLIFCDTRESKVIKVEDSKSPNRNDIYTWRQAVPTYDGYLNVCDIEVLKIELPAPK